MNRKTYIYALLDPSTLQCRYVGKTLNLEERFKSHCKDKVKSKRRSWIDSLKPLKPEMIVLEECFVNWEEAEQFWIEYFRFLGARLTNLAVGGGGSNGFKLTEEQRIAFGIRKRKENLSPETRVRLSQSKIGNQNGKGYKHTPEAIAKIVEGNRRKAGKKRSEESKQRMSEAAKSRIRKPHSEETKQRISKAHQKRKELEKELEELLKSVTLEYVPYNFSN